METDVPGEEEEDFQVQAPNLEQDGLPVRLREAVRLAGSKGGLAAKTGIKERTLGYLLAGQDAKLSQLRRISDGVGIRLEWLATGRGPLREGELAAAGGTDLQATSGTVVISRYDARAAAGKASLLPASHVIERIQFAEEWIRVKLRRNPQNLAIIEAFGDSMEPTIADGDQLMLDLAVSDIHSGRIYVLDVGGELLVKRINRRISGHLVVMSDNPRYPPEEVPPSEHNPLRIIGEVVWHGRLI